METSVNLWIEVIIIGFRKDQNSQKYKHSECYKAALHNCDSKLGWLDAVVLADLLWARTVSHKTGSLMFGGIIRRKEQFY